jgi:hypothetical protein
VSQSELVVSNGKFMAHSLPVVSTVCRSNHLSLHQKVQFIGKTCNHTTNTAAGTSLCGRWFVFGPNTVFAHFRRAFNFWALPKNAFLLLTWRAPLLARKIFCSKTWILLRGGLRGELMIDSDVYCTVQGVAKVRFSLKNGFISPNQL